MPEHTLGPWEIRKAYISGNGKDDDPFGAAVFHVYRVGELLHYVAEIGQASPNAEGNACRIAAVPEMVDALELVATWMACPPAMKQIVKAALAKATVTGRSIGL